MRISEYRNFVITCAACALLFDRGDAGPVKAQNPSNLPNVHRIVESSIAATQRQWQARLHYTYIERDEDRRRDSAGHVTSKDVTVSRTILVDGVPFDELVESNGRPLSAGEVRKQKKDLNKLKREDPEERAERLRKHWKRLRRLSTKCPRPSTSSWSAKNQ